MLIRSSLLFVMLLLVGLLSTFITPSHMKGVNLLQSHTIAFNQPPTLLSFKRLKSMGGNSVAFIPFMRQESHDAVLLKRSDSVTDSQLIGGIRYARQLALKTVLKPQILIAGSWSGAINHEHTAAWVAWFNAYQRILLEYAKIAEAEQVDIFVIGTELVNARKRPEWKTLITEVRKYYHRELSYSAHNISGLKQFKYWKLLDNASVTLYPSLSKTRNALQMNQTIKKTVQQLKQFTAVQQIPLWISEVGIASRQGAYLNPWQWRFSAAQKQQLKTDENLQSFVLGKWLHALNGKWNKGVFIWAWSNDPMAGGQQNRDFTPQNKIAQSTIQCAWRWYCRNSPQLEGL